MAILSFTDSSCNNVALQIGAHAVARMTIRTIMHVSMLSPRGGGGDPGQMWGI